MDILEELIKNLDNMSVYELAEVLRLHHDCVALKLWTRRDIAYSSDVELTEEQIDDAADKCGDLEDCLEEEWMVIDDAIDEVIKGE